MHSPRKFPTTCNLSSFASSIGHADYVNGPVYVNVNVNVYTLYVRDNNERWSSFIRCVVTAGKFAAKCATHVYA